MLATGNAQDVSSVDSIQQELNYYTNRPRRQTFLFFINHYRILIGGGITIVITVSVLPFAPQWTLLWVVLYWIYFTLMVVLRKRNTENDRVMFFNYHSAFIQFLRSFLLIACTTGFIAYLYTHTEYLEKVSGNDTLWLLYILAISVSSQHSTTEVTIITLLCSFIANIYLIFSTDFTWTVPIWWLLSTRIIWLTMITFIIHIFLRYVMEAYANMRLLDRIQRELLGLQSSASENDIMQSVVTAIANDFNYPHVNIFIPSKDGMKCVAGACESGRSFVKHGFTLEYQKGLVGAAFNSGRTQLSNNVDADKNRYHHHSAFPNTKSELVVPIRQRNNELLGVLDIQATRKQTFIPTDREVMENLATYLGTILESRKISKEFSEIVLSKQRTAKIVESIISRFLSQSQMIGTLNEIARAAHEELDVDVVILYERNSLTGHITGPIYAGHINYPDELSKVDKGEDSLILRLLADKRTYHFHPNLLDYSDDPVFKPTKEQAQEGTHTFVEREEIKSRAIVCLEVGMKRLGLMFFNFRHLQDIDEFEKQAILTFANLASLALQKMQFHQQQLLFERESLASQIHDQLLANADASLMFIKQALRSKDIAGYIEAKLRNAKDAVIDLRRDIRYLNDTIRDTSFSGLPREVEELAKRVNLAYGTIFEVHWEGSGETVPVEVGAQLKLILNEAVLNAINHGEATHIEFNFKIQDGTIWAKIKDDGIGFDLNQIKPRGLENMKKRAEALGGTFKISSTPKEGTTLLLEVLWDAKQKGRPKNVFVSN